MKTLTSEKCKLLKISECNKMEHVIEMKEDKIRITPPSTSTPQSASTPPSRTSSSASSTAGSNCSNR